MHYSKSDNSNEGRILFLTSLSIPPSKYGLNNSAIISTMHHEFYFVFCLHSQARTHSRPHHIRNSHFHEVIINKARLVEKQDQHI
jgi:hypothetical protein